MHSLTVLIEHLKDTGVLHTPAIVRAFECVDRKRFVSSELHNLAYADEALPIGAGQTISQPYTIAFMLERLNVRKGDCILDVGSGSGYTTALLAELTGKTGRVFGVERVPELVAYGKENLASFNFAHADIRQAETTLGLISEAPFEKILVSASAEQLPQPLVKQLKSGGRMVIPVGDEIWNVVKCTDETLVIKKYRGFVFVPLIESNAT